jgi:hypothetical protein
MKKKIRKLKLLLPVIVLFVALVATFNTKGQSTCATAVSFTPSDTFKTTTYNITDSLYWLKFVASDPTIFLQIVTPNNAPQASINHIYLYRGSCAKLTLLSSSSVNDSLIIAYAPLTVGSTYFVKVNRTATTSAYFGLGFQNVKQQGPPVLTCWPPSCDLIRDGQFETNHCPTNYNHSPFYPSWIPHIPPTDTSNDVCGWMRAWGTPQLTPFTSAGNHFAMMWCMGRTGEGIMQTVNIPAGTYTLDFSFRVPVGYASMDSLIICLTTIDFAEHTTWDNNGRAIPYSYWHANTRDIIYSATNVAASTNWHHVTVPFTTTSFFPRFVIYPSQAQGNTTYLFVDSVSIFASPPDPPVIAGQWNTCHTVNGIVTTSDTIKNWNPAYTYFYSFGPNNNLYTITSNPFTVDWTGHENGGMLYVTVRNDSTNCTAVDSIKVFSCCAKSPGNASIIADSTFSTNTTLYGEYYINGQIIIDANVTFGGSTYQCAIEMGPNAKIIINPGKTLTINRQSHLEAYCDTMWDGIYISDNTAHLILKDTSTVKDAKNAVVSNNGGDFQITNCVVLKNNYKNIVVNSYAGNHAGKISQTSIKCDATLKTQFPSVIASRTYSGVEISTVAKIFIGDTTAYTKRNTFDNMDYGINARCSHIYVYNNKFLNINATYPTSTIGSAVYAFGGRNCGDIAVVGGQNASGYYRSNYFNNCFNGIYYSSSVGNYIKAEYDTLVMQTTANTLPTGIYAYAAGTSEGTIRYNKITNGDYGIRCIDFGAGASLNISSNYIEKANTGIAATNVNLTAPYTFQIAKNFISYPNTYTTTQTGILVTNIDSSAGGATPYAFISRNRIFFTNPSLGYTAYGIRVQNSPHTHIEANCVANTTTTVAADSNQAKRFTGIKVELSQYAYLCEDTIFRIGCGLRFYGSMSPSKIKVNMMDSTWFGVRFDTANVGQQGIATMGNGNKWRGLQTWRVNGTWTPANWYGYSTPNPLTLLPVANYVKTSPTAGSYIFNASSYLTSCSTITPQNLISPLQSTVDGQTYYPFAEAENKYTEKVNAYLTLKNDPSLLSSLAISSNKYQIFFNTVAASNIGSFVRVNDLMVAGNYSNAQVLNSGISPTNTMEINRKTVNAIYLNSWANGRFELTSDEYNTLYAIASQQPIMGGTGVYSARVMVGEPATIMSNLKTIGTNDNLVKSNAVGLIYPNPVTDDASIDYTIVTSSKAVLKLFSITGKEIATYELNTKDNHFTFNTEQFNTGIYFYQLIANGEIISYNKFVIIK